MSARKVPPPRIHASQLARLYDFGTVYMRVIYLLNVSLAQRNYRYRSIYAFGRYYAVCLCLAVGGRTPHAEFCQLPPEKNPQLPPRLDDNLYVESEAMNNHPQFLLWPPYVIGQTIICSSCSFFLSSFYLLLFFPRLISAVGDWMSTILLHMAWP